MPENYNHIKTSMSLILKDTSWFTTYFIGTNLLPTIKLLGFKRNDSS